MVLVVLPTVDELDDFLLLCFITSAETLLRGTNSPIVSTSSCIIAVLSMLIMASGAVTTSGAPSYSGNRLVTPENFQKSDTQFLNEVAYGWLITSLSVFDRVMPSPKSVTFVDEPGTIFRSMLYFLNLGISSLSPGSTAAAKFVSFKFAICSVSKLSTRIPFLKRFSPSASVTTRSVADFSSAFRTV